MPVTLLKKLVDAICVDTGQIQIAGPPGQRPRIALVTIDRGTMGDLVGRIRRAEPPDPKIFEKALKAKEKAKMRPPASDADDETQFWTMSHNRNKIVIDRTFSLQRKHLNCMAVMVIDKELPTSACGHLAKLEWRPTENVPFENVDDSYLVYKKGIDERKLWVTHLTFLEAKYYEALRASEEKRARISIISGPVEAYETAVNDVYEIEIDNTAKHTRFSRVYRVVRKDGMPLCDHDWIFLKRKFDWISPGPMPYTRGVESNRWVIPIKPQPLTRRE